MSPSADLHKTASDTAPVLEAKGVSKSFGAIEVLRDISIDLLPGRVHAVIGENGAGKSTLMKVLSGHLPPTRGELRLHGEPVGFRDSVEAERAGIALVHQEILLAGHLSIAQNLFLGRERRRGPFIDDRAMRAASVAVLQSLGVALLPDLVVNTLSVGQRQFVQIARALLVHHRVVIFDEPTAALTPLDAELLFGAIRKLTAAGVAVLYISHRLPEVKAIADTVTVLRDGNHVGTWDAGNLEPTDMARLMVGREMANLFPARAIVPPGAPVVLEAEHIAVPGYVRDASFSVRQGEILGFAGLIGAGRTELFEGMLGLRARTRGAVRVFGQDRWFADAGDAMAAGVVYLSEDRKGKGLLLAQDLRTNLTLAALERYTSAGLIDRIREWAGLDQAIGTFDIRVGRRDLLAGQMSGGNQQKLLLAKMMERDPRVIVIDEPTRGIDIGTKSQIYHFVAGLANKGLACIVISSEMQELIGLCHRILVMREGAIVAEIDGETATEDEIVFRATGVHEQPASAPSAA